jgi:ParB family chromosome partitioning protein
MAERLEVSKSWLSRYLELARLPAEALAAFASPQAVGISHAATLAPLLRAENEKDRVIAEAQRLVAEQSDRIQRGENPIPPAAVVQCLVAVVRVPTIACKTSAPREHVVRSAEGVVIARGQRARGEGR